MQCARCRQQNKVFEFYRQRNLLAGTLSGRGWEFLRGFERSAGGYAMRPVPTTKQSPLLKKITPLEQGTLHSASPLCEAELCVRLAPHHQPPPHPKSSDPPGGRNQHYLSPVGRSARQIGATPVHLRSTRRMDRAARLVVNQGNDEGVDLCPRPRRCPTICRQDCPRAAAAKLLTSHRAYVGWHLRRIAGYPERE